MKRAMLGFVVLATACRPAAPASARATVPASAPVAALHVPLDAPPDESLDGEACARLCARERACPGTDEQLCARACDADRRRMKPGFVASYVGCFEPELARLTCGDGPARERLHLACFDKALAKYPRDEQNQREMAEPVCDRGERCMGLGKLGREACMQATLNPQESEIRLGQRLVDALQAARVLSFRRCVDEAPCAKPGASDDVVDRCYAKTIAESS